MNHRHWIIITIIIITIIIIIVTVIIIIIIVIVIVIVIIIIIIIIIVIAIAIIESSSLNHNHHHHHHHYHCHRHLRRHHHIPGMFEQQFGTPWAKCWWVGSPIADQLERTTDSFSATKAGFKNDVFLCNLYFVLKSTVRRTSVNGFYPTVIKHGLLENHPFTIDSFSSMIVPLKPPFSSERFS